VTLAELLHAPVVDRGARHNFPVDHELNFTELADVIGEADMVAAFEVEDLYGALVRHRADSPKGIHHVAAGHLRVRSWAHDVGELAAIERLITASAETALPALVARLRAAPPPDDLIKARRARVGDRASARRQRLWVDARAATSDGALHPARLAAETWDAIAGLDPLVVHSRPTDWERRLWPLSGFAAHLGWHGGGGLGYGLGASIGAALGLKGTERLLVDLQPDGDFLYSPSALWTAAATSVPLLILVHNNRQYGNTVEHAAVLAEQRARTAAQRHAGAGLADPPVDFVGLARSFGVWATGPVSDPDGIARALSAAVEVVSAGRPALVEFLTSGV
jgi:acetolactate synthase I/II/III large subunit